MITSKIETGKLVLLRQIELSDCTDTYVQWLNDPNVNQYLETKWQKQDMDAVWRFVQLQRENNHSVLFAIVFLDGRQHIGNLKIGPIHSHYKYGDISYFIGEKQLWGKGLATEAIKLACKFGFEERGLHKLEAGAYENAIGSWKALEKNGFKREGIIRDHGIVKNKFVNVFRYGLLKDEF